MNQSIIDMLKRKGVSAVAFVALGILICAESDQVRLMAVQFSALFGGTSAAMTALSVWLSLRKDTQNAADVVVAKYTPAPTLPVSEKEAAILEAAGVELPK